MDKLGISLLLTQIALLIVISGGIITSVKEHNQTPDTVYVQKRYSDLELMEVAIIWQESKGNPNPKYSNGESEGLYQITPTYIDEVNRILGYNKYSYEDSKDAVKSKEMFSVVQKYHNKEKCPKMAIKLHNKGDEYYNEVMDKFRMLKYLNEK